MVNGNTVNVAARVQNADGNFNGAIWLSVSGGIKERLHPSFY